MKTIQELIDFVDSRFAEYYGRTDQTGAGGARARTLAEIRLALVAGRFPTTEQQRYELSLVPFVFQEANYDDIAWGPGTSHFGHLQDLFDLDFYVAFGGRERSEVTEQEERSYWDERDRFIDRRTGQTPLGGFMERMVLRFLKIRG